MRQLNSKSFTVTQELSRYFLSINYGDRILTISEFEEILDVARGTIQNSLQILKDSRAISLASRGKLGTFLEESNPVLLMKFANIDFIIGVMPLPYSRTYEGLSSGILKELNVKLKVPVNMAYMRGAQKRLELVASGRYDFAIVSKFAAMEYIKNSKSNLMICLDFNKYSYLHGHSIIFRNSENSEICDGMKIGVDYDSIDQMLLTEMVTSGKKVSLIPMSYTQFETGLIRGDIDAVVWNTDEVSANLSSLRHIPIKSEDDLTTTAVLVVDAARPELINILRNNIDIKSILDIQDKVREGTIIPQY